ncbi:PREDICTED: spindle and kinetochore-associated protein 1 isoform X3 [Galeopterus variegatus]|uniref:SKA complex subunit 1 n=1 Tax=Galeopterus variegatus TaxID=482537 RepID=A0ABM0RVQ2_GALVR|nr:PREDICTED: spindle and kinetochore-associated protein 1 isoform X3 [Galeopterus variegatus]
MAESVRSLKHGRASIAAFRGRGHLVSRVRTVAACAASALEATWQHLLRDFHADAVILESDSELCESLEEDYKDVEHLKENIPSHLPQVTVTQSSFKGSGLDPEEPVKVEEPVPTKKPPKEQRIIKEMPFITCDEFNDVPAYMKSRLTYSQINDVIKEINKAIISKYKILHQPKKSMNSLARNLYHRFIDEETKDTKGHYFIVEADIKEFTTLKVDKKFHMLLNILRHCRRLSEVRGGGLTRYVIT